MADGVKLGGRMQGKTQRLADLLHGVSSGSMQGPEFDRSLLEKLARKSHQEVADIVNGMGVTHVSFDEAGYLAQHQIDTLEYITKAQTSSQVRQKTLADYSDTDLVMEMIRRGYAAMKLPKDGGPPEVLRG